MKFNDVIDPLLKHEGGYTTDSDDPGNWTGGKKGAGELKGTKFGIAANSYPDLDIKNLSLDEAKEIYKRDYWDKCHADELPEDIRQIHFDTAVNMGRGAAAKILQRAAKVNDDGKIGPVTLRAAKNVNLRSYAVERLRWYTKVILNNPTSIKYARGWYGRVLDLVIK
jgi:lysozyme family protein